MKTLFKSIIAILTLITANQLSAEYVFYHQNGDVRTPITEAEHNQIYPILLDYQFPMCLTNPNITKDVEGMQQYQEEQLIRDKIPKNIQMQFIPKTSYELCFIIALLEYCKNTSFDKHLYRKEEFPMDKDGEFFVLTNKPFNEMSSWNEQEYYSICKNALTNPLLMKYHFMLNNKIVEYANQLGNIEKHDDFCQKLITQINTLQDELKTINIIHKYLREYRDIKNATVISNIKEIAGSKYDEIINKAQEDSDKVIDLLNHLEQIMPKYALGLHNESQGLTHLELNLKSNEKQKQAILQAVDIEVQAHHDGNWVLYRGSESNAKEELTKEGNPYSLSYGNSLFAGLIYETDKDLGKGAMAFLFIGERGGYALLINMLDYIRGSLTRKLFFITPISTILGLFGIGEIFHPRSKIYSTEKVLEFEKIAGFGFFVSLPIEYVRTDTQLFKTREDFEAAFHQYFYKNRRILGK